MIIKVKRETSFTLFVLNAFTTCGVNWTEVTKVARIPINIQNIYLIKK